MHIRVNDTVEVISGGDKGKRGKVLKVDREEGKITVQGIGLVWRHLKASRTSQGGRLSKEMPISISNVLLIDPTNNKPTRTGVRYTDDGTKELYAKKSGTTIRVLAKADPKYAKKA
ncbi:50S ribosomal protein L24 [Zavarzinella formosa]|uniref:50S ribosomal protein L24 n=1 Tax=Zavarzinella formosa TaxID=360055 RepID=UPI0003028EF6|nr:50S ribosomal protein L24 [Zavarzinella formosa]